MSTTGRCFGMADLKVQPAQAKWPNQCIDPAEHYFDHPIDKSQVYLQHLLKFWEGHRLDRSVEGLIVYSRHLSIKRSNTLKIGSRIKRNHSWSQLKILLLIQKVEEQPRGQIQPNMLEDGKSSGRSINIVFLRPKTGFKRTNLQKDGHKHISVFLLLYDRSYAKVNVLSTFMVSHHVILKIISNRPREKIEELVELWKQDRNSRFLR